MKYAIIDISSSSISLLAAEGEKNFDILLRERENISILHYMEGRNLSERGVEKLVENLNKMKEICKKTGVEKCYVISTASMRNFENFGWVTSEIKRRAAVNVNLLDGQEEAYCDLVSNEQYKALNRAVLADIGGGSIELCDLTKDNPEALTYLDFGPIQISRKFVKHIHPDEAETKIIQKHVKKKLEKSGLPGESAFATAVLVGATNRAIYDVYCDYYDETETGGEKRIEYDRLKKLCKHLVRSSDRSMLVLKNAPEKIYTLTTAAVVLRAMLKYFGVANIVVSDFGVKEGYLALVTGGKWQGVETDLQEIPAADREVFLESPEEKTEKTSKKKSLRKAEKADFESVKSPEKKSSSHKKKEETERKSYLPEEQSAPTPASPARRGRPRKVQTEGAPISASTGEEGQDTTQHSQRTPRRPRIKKTENPAVETSANEEESAPVRRVRRPRARKAESSAGEEGIEEKTDTAPVKRIRRPRANKAGMPFKESSPLEKEMRQEIAAPVQSPRTEEGNEANENAVAKTDENAKTEEKEE